jgi:hypothetical protein
VRALAELPGRSARGSSRCLPCGVWYLRYSLITGPADYTLRFVDAGSKPVVGDRNGDGYDQPGIFRDVRWQLMDTFWAEVDSDDGKRFVYGRAGDVPWSETGTATAW